MRENGLYIMAYEPFRREARYCFGLDLLISFVLAICFFLLHLFSSPLFCMIIPLYFLIEIIVNYRIGLLSRLESKRRLFVSTLVSITKIQDEYSPSGRWNSIIPKLYPPHLRVNRYRIIGRDSIGNMINLRCAISGEKWQLIHDNIGEGIGWDRLITYGKLTHIILSFDNKDDISFKLNRNL